MTTTGFAGDTPARHGTQFVFIYRWDQPGEGISHYACTKCAADITVAHRINGDATLTVHGRWHATLETNGGHSCETPDQDEWVLKEKYDWADQPRPGRQQALAHHEYPMDVCPACGYAGAMGLNLMHPATGSVTWLRCHRCGADRALPQLPGETP